jgi:hypothetical protein
MDPENPRPPSPLETATFFGTLRQMMVGPPAYWQHWKEVLEGLFEGPSVRASVESALGISLKAVLDISTAICEQMSQQIVERLQEAGRQRERLQRDLDAYISTGRHHGDADEKIVLDRLRSLRPKERKRCLKHMLIQWAFVALADQLSFTVKSLCERTGIATCTVEWFLEIFHTCPGSTPAGFLLPGPSNLLRRKPIVKLENQYFCPVPHRLLWTIKPSLEEILQKHPLWEIYQQTRATFLISEAMKLFRQMLPGSTVETSVYYPIGDGLEAELDALVTFDRYVFVVEGKAGSRKRAYKEEAIQKRIEELVGVSSRQAIRARDYLRDNSIPTLRRSDGTTFTLNKTALTELVPISISLDSLDAFTSELNEVREITGLTEPVWAVCLTDLRVISEIVSRPSEFTHFLRWRIALGSKRDILGDRDEINWLAVYLREGPSTPKPPEGNDWLSFLSYTDGFDAYFLHKQGDRTKAEPRPTQEIPRTVGKILDALENSMLAGFTKAAEFILDCTFEQRRRLSEAADELALLSKRSTQQGRVNVDCGDRVIVLVSGATAENWDMGSEPSGKVDGKQTLVLVADPLADWRVHTWTSVPL